METKLVKIKNLEPSSDANPTNERIDGGGRYASPTQAR